MKMSIAAMIIGASLLCAAQSPRGQLAPIKLEPVKQLRKGVDLWPLIANPTTAAEQRVNAALIKLNNVLAGAIKDCDATSREDAADSETSPTTGSWQRSIAITMTGPRYLSLVARDQLFCGGAHPDSDTMAMVFDLDSGRPVNWLQLISSSANPKAHADTVSDGSTIAAVVLPALLDTSKAKADPDCKDAFDDAQSYQLWPDARSGTLIAQPFGLPHVVAACGDELELSPDQARKLGFNEALLKAIAEAHQHWPSKPQE